MGDEGVRHYVARETGESVLQVAPMWAVWTTDGEKVNAWCVCDLGARNLYAMPQKCAMFEHHRVVANLSELGE